MGQRPNSTFSEYGHVVYQIKGNGTCSNMVANILPTDLKQPFAGDIKLTNMPRLTSVLPGDTSDSRNSSFIIILYDQHH